jgi:hypothetical protein
VGTKRYQKLKMALKLEEMTYDSLKRMMGKKRNYLANRMTGRIPWNMDDVYWFCDNLNIPYEQISEYFPKKGID